MSTLRQVKAFFWVDLIITTRFWYVSLFTVGMTGFYYLMLSRFFPTELRQEMTVTFVVLAVLGISLYHFATRASMERVEQWNSFVRTLSTPLWVRFVARMVLVLLVGAFAAVMLMAVGRIAFDLRYDPSTLAMAIVAVPAAAAVFAPIGACVGGAVHPRFAPAMMTVIYLGSTWSAGVWSRGQQPEILGPVGQLLPAQVVEGLAVTVAGQDWAMLGPYLVLVGAWALVAFAVARWIYIRDEGEKY